MKFEDLKGFAFDLTALLPTRPVSTRKLGIN